MFTLMFDSEVEEYHDIEHLKDKLYKNNIVLYGAGYLGILVARALKSYGIIPVAFVDGDSSKWNLEVEDLKIYSPEEISKYYSSLCFIVCMYRKEDLYLSIKKILNQLGYEKVYHILQFRKLNSIFFEKHLLLDTNYKDIIKNNHNIDKVYNLFADNMSKQQYTLVFKFMMNDYDTVVTSLSLEQQYFAYDIYNKIENEVFVDCGAFDGSIMELFLKNVNYEFNKYIAIEPDPDNMQRLEKKLNSMPKKVASKVKPILKALSDKEELIQLDNISNMNTIPTRQGNIIVKSNVLDFFLQNEIPTFIKIDVEGYDKKVLQSSIEIIKQSMPIIAIAIYHDTRHFWEIPIWIHEHFPMYKLYFRSYMNRAESICYAIPPSRQVITCKG